DYAISQGVIIVTSAGNKGAAGMSYPGGNEPVISVAASGWTGEWLPPGNTNWWNDSDVSDPTNPDDYYIVPWSSRELPGQDLDVAAPGTWIVGPYQYQMGKISYFFKSGTSMSSPHVAGIVALMAQKYPSLTALQAENILESSAIPLPPGCRIVLTPWGWEEACWDDDAAGAGLATANAALDATP
ncbi:MAG: S8 family serine peptidase, partial [Desulfomonilia bacterium]|nr:S8 family serine peptidase [Desulfomonilia bacterium]